MAIPCITCLKSQRAFGTTTVIEPIVTTSEQCDTMYVHAADVLYNIPGQVKVQDPYNTMFVIGFNGPTGIWMTREALNFNTTPSWVRLNNAPSGSNGTKAIEFVETGEHKGDVMFYTGWDGSVTRVTGLRDVYTQEDVNDSLFTTMLASAGSAVTGLSVDPNDPNHVVVTIGGYLSSASGKVRETFNALSPDFNPLTDWNNIWTAPSMARTTS